MSKIELDVRNLEVSFSTPQGNFSAVNGINFQLYSGETLALVGESGWWQNSKCSFYLKASSGTSCTNNQWRNNLFGMQSPFPELQTNEED